MHDIQPVMDMLNVHAKQYKSYGDYSVTTLLNPPRQVHLTKRYKHESKVDYMNLMPSFMGTGIHAYVEHCLNVAGKGYQLERGVMDKINDRVITGTFDILDADGNIFDIKTCKTWKLIFDPDMTEWHEQQNIYAYLLHQRGIDVKSINIIAIYMDFVPSQAQRRKDYPQMPVMQYELNKWPNDTTRDFLAHRIDLMKAAEDTPDDELPVCTAEERWEDPATFACVKKIGGRAARVLTDIDSAIEWLRSHKGFGPGSGIECRHAIRKRCERYCDINFKCNVYQQYLHNKKTNSLTEVIPYEQI